MDAKSNLKEAREAIKNKDYKTAMRLSKAILRDDKSNYMAYILLGISLQEIGPMEQAILAYKKAVQVNENNILGWNGIISYYEKNREVKHSVKELIDAYKNVLKLETNEAKLSEIIQKLSNIKTRNNSTLQAIYDFALSEKAAGVLKDECFKIIATNLDGDVPEDMFDVYRNSLTALLKNPETANKDTHHNLIKFLYKLKEYDNVLTEAEIMHKLYKSDTSSLEWICKLYNELRIDDQELYKSHSEKINDYCDILLTLNDKSAFGLVTKSFRLNEENNLLDYVKCLKQATVSQPGYFHAWFLYAQCLQKLHFYSDAAEAATNCLKLLEKTSYDNTKLKPEITNCLITSLCRSSNKSDLLEGVKLCQPYDENLIRAYINLGDYIEAEMALGKLEDGKTAALLKATLQYRKNNYNAALNTLLRAPMATSEYYLLLGKTYWALNEHKSSLVPFLKASKSDPNSYECYLHLGNWYQKFNDLNKAQRCYERAFKINGRCCEAGMELSKMYRKQHKWEENLNLLKSLTSGKIDVNMKWACLELGIHYLEKEEYNEAIDTLRFVVRIDSNNSHCWESLADAYLARGAYTSALKSYQKAAELRPEALYSLYQIANIKKVLGEYAEAHKDFEAVLQFDRNYVLALKGLAETSLYQCRQYLRQQLHGLARDYAQKALEYSTRGLKRRSHLSCLWKILADCCVIVAKLPEKYSCLMVPAALAEGKLEDRSVMIEEDNLFNLSERCYFRAIELTEENVLIYHDLSNCYFYHARAKKSAALFEKALKVINYCIVKNPSHWQHWNLYGNIVYFQESKNLPLAQHAFIKAVSLERNSAVSWCNLGSIYLEEGDVKLANDTFSQAQRADPNYINSWVGQAMIAELVGHEDAMDLYRHTTQLGYHSQGAAGYGHWVCRTLAESPLDVKIYSIHNMHAVPVACDSLTWYTENHPDDPCAWNMLGIMRERMGLKKSTATAYRNALHYSEQANQDAANVNYGRAMRVTGKYSEAVNAYRNVKEATFNSGSGLALALFKDEQYQDSYEAYEQALHWLTEEEGNQSDLLVALAAMAYEFQGAEAAKTLLFQSSQLKPRSPWSLYAMLSLALLHDDNNLANAILKELEELKDTKECLGHYGILLAYTHLLQGNNTKAVRELSKLIHRHPDQAALWLSLAILLLRLHKERKVTSGVAKCATVAMKLGRLQMDVTKVLCIVSLASLLAGNVADSLRAAQSAIHTYPDVAEGWCILACALKHAKNKSQPDISELKKHVLSNMNIGTVLKNYVNNSL